MKYKNLIIDIHNKRYYGRNRKLMNFATIKSKKKGNKITDWFNAFTKEELERLNKLRVFNDENWIFRGNKQ